MSNNITVVGNVTRDPEIKFLPSGAALATFGLAVNRRWYNKNENDWEEETSFFDVLAWAQLGENIADTIEKGDRVIIEGRLQQRSWENDDGQKRSKVEIVANDVGPSLRWATASIEKTDFNYNTNTGESSSSNEPF